MTGFCPKGRNCSFGHPKYELPTSNAVEDLIPLDSEQAQRQAQYQQQASGAANRGGQQRNLNEVTCFKCGESGHYANHVRMFC